MSALPPKADIREHSCDVRYVPQAEVAAIRSAELIVQPAAKDAVGEMGVRGDLPLAGRESMFREHLYKCIWPNLDRPTEGSVDADDDQQFRKDHYRE
jgi:hypothetical protein